MYASRKKQKLSRERSSRFKSIEALQEYVFPHGYGVDSLMTVYIGDKDGQIDYQDDGYGDDI